MNLNFLKRLSVLFVGLTVLHCATSYPEKDLVSQILRARAEFPGYLTNTSCEKYVGDECKGGYKLSSYDLKDPVVREKLVRLDFICSVGGRRFKIDPDKPGFVRLNQIEKCARWDVLHVFCQRVVEQEFLGIEPWDFLVDADVRCFQKNRYPFSW